MTIVFALSVIYIITILWRANYVLIFNEFLGLWVAVRTFPGSGFALVPCTVHYKQVTDLMQTSSALW